MKLTLDQIDQTIRNLGRLMPAKPNKNSKREYSLKESIFLIAPKLLEMRDMGFTSKELVTALADEEIVIKGATLNHYLCEYQKQAKEKTESGPATDAKPEQVSSAKSNPAVGASTEQTTGTKLNPAVGTNPEQTSTKPNPAEGANPKQGTGPKSSPAVGEKPKPTTEPESASSTAAKSERAMAWDKSSSTDQSANRPNSSTWQSEKGGGADEAPV